MCSSPYPHSHTPHTPHTPLPVTSRETCGVAGWTCSQGSLRFHEFAAFCTSIVAEAAEAEGQTAPQAQRDPGGGGGGGGGGVPVARVVPWPGVGARPEAQSAESEKVGVEAGGEAKAGVAEPGGAARAGEH